MLPLQFNYREAQIMKELDALRDLFSVQLQDINVLFFLLQMILTSLLCLVIAQVYIRYGHSLSNRRTLSRSFVLIGLTTMIIITIVKSSLALSLGLVGALSIVRFRTAIKEPEELAYFFMVIAIGLGVGAGQMLVTLIGAAGLCLLIILAHRNKAQDISQNLIISLEGDQQDALGKITSILESSSSQLELRRVEEAPERTEIVYSVGFRSLDQLVEAKSKLREAYPGLSFSFLEMI